MSFLALHHLFWVIPLALAALAVGLIALRQRRRTIALLTQNATQCHLQTNASPVRRRLLTIALSAALLLALLATLRPSGGTEISEHRRPAKNIVVLLDISRSMLVNDSDGLSRIDSAKLLLRDLINNRPTDRIGLLSFTGATLTESPVTLDRSLLLEKINKIQVGDIRVGGTDLNSALREAQNLLTDSPPSGSSILILSDGDNITGEDPAEVVEKLKKANIPIISVAFGLDQVPVNVPGTNASTQADHAFLRRFSDATNGLFLAASPKNLDSQIAELNNRIDRIEVNGTDVAPELFERPLDLYAWPLAFAVLALFIHLFTPLRSKSWHPLTAALTLLFILPISTQAREFPSYEEALEFAQTEERPVLLIFTGSDWSQLSITFEKEILKHQTFLDWANRKVARVLIDLPRVGISDEERAAIRELAQKFQVETYPRAVFLNPQGEILGSLTHDPDGPASWIKRANAILDGDQSASDSPASADFLPQEVRDQLEDPDLTPAQKSVRLYNKALELERANPTLAFESKDRFNLLLDLYSKAAEAAPTDRPDLAFAPEHKIALLHHRKALTLLPTSEQDLMMKSLGQQTTPDKLLNTTKRTLQAALNSYKRAAPLQPGDEELSANLALAYQNLKTTQAFIDYLKAYLEAVNKTITARDQEAQFAQSLEREVTTSLEINTTGIEESMQAIQDLVKKAEAIESPPTILPEKALEDYRLAEEDIALAPSPHRQRHLPQSLQHIQDALDHLIDPQQLQQQPQSGEGQGEGEPQEGEGEEPQEGDENEGGRQRDLRPQGDRPGEEDLGQQGGGGEEDAQERETNRENDLRRAEQEGGDLRGRLLDRLRDNALRNGKRVPPNKDH